jgi:hypothetical protein
MLNTPGPPMTLGNMREQGVHHLIAFCLHDACRHRHPVARRERLISEEIFTIFAWTRILATRA